ncbi:MAG TPA: class I SAM-dependent methyltransferase [Thermoleophilia bacterium]|nr:class I SAM-dependent methyltransferase [Thermoleophilia bacterium]
MRQAGDEHDAYQAAGFAEVYDAVYAGRDDAPFWATIASAAGDHHVLELGCGTGRVLLPLAREGYSVTGVDLSESMLDVCRAKLRLEPPAVRERVRLLAADMTSFELGRRFGAITIPFASFQHLLSVEQQLACLERCGAHLLPHGVLVIDLPNPAPAPLSAAQQQPDAGATPVEVVDWTEGRRIRWWAEVTESRRSEQIHAFRVTYEVVDADGSVRRLEEPLLLRYVFRYELEHLLVRAGFRVVANYGDYDHSPYGDESPAMIVVAEPADGAGGEAPCS